jgi:hypothetical protein
MLFREVVYTTLFFLFFTLILFLLSYSIRRFLLFDISAWGFFAFGYYGTIMAITEIFDSKGDSNAQDQKNTYKFDYGAIFVSSSAELVVSLAGC